MNRYREDCIARAKIRRILSGRDEKRRPWSKPRPHGGRDRTDCGKRFAAWRRERAAAVLRAAILSGGLA